MKEERIQCRQPRRQYEIFWERDAALPERVAKAWEEVSRKHDLGEVMQGLDSVMSSLQDWSKRKFGNIVRELKNVISRLEVLLLNNPEQREIGQALIT
jgi:hypothetical protein